MKRAIVFLVVFAVFAVRAEFTCSVKLEGTAQAGVERSGTVSWKNDGPALAAPLVRISAGDGVVVRLTANDVWASSIEFLATSSGLPPSRLHAGESGSLPFLVRSATTEGKLELSYTTASADPFPWTEIGDSLKPSSVTDEAWAFALKTLKTRLGTTWDSYLARFRSDVDLFARNGCFERRMDRLMQYELARALGTDSVIPALSEAQDAARSARGLGLALTRTYPSSVSARFVSGMFGYGWTDNLSTVAELTDAKTLVFRTPGGVSCTFTKASGSWQPEDVRDRTRLTETASAYVLTYQSGMIQTFARSNMRTASITDSSGNQLTFTWNGVQLVKVAHTDGQFLTFAYANGLLASVTDDCGRQTTYAYANGLLTSVTSFDGQTTRYEYRPADGSMTARALTRIAYPDGTTREFAYGEDGLVASLSSDGGKEKSTIIRRECEVTLTGPDGSKTVMKTGVTGEAYETKDALGGTSVSRYGADGLLKAVVSPSGLTSTLQHDAYGRVVEMTSASEATTTFAYEETFGNLRSVTDAKGHAVTYGYDSKGRGTSVTLPDNSSSRVEYNSRGDVVKTYNRRGESVSYAYDARGRLAQKTWSNGRTFTYAYDARGNVTEASDSETGTVKMEYDTAEWMTKISYPGGRGFTFEYDAYGRLTRRSSLDGTAECFAYDVRGRLASVTDGEGNPYLRNVYDETTGRLVRQENGNGTSTTYLYDKLGRTTSIEHLNADGKIVEALEYCYDVDGRCIRASSVFGEERFGYDADGQVTQAVYPDAPAETFAYDAVGNRMTANGADYTVNAINQYTAVSASSSTSSATFTYDRDGNLTSMTDADGTTAYGYDTLNRLVSVKNASAGIDWSCKYDALGNRVSVTENGVTTERVYLQGSLPSVAAEYVNGELKSRHILVGAVRIADVTGEAAFSPLEQKGAIRYLHADLIGSVRLVTDADGYTQSRATYRAFGELRGGWDMDGIDGYVGTLGVETDSTGLLFMRNRYYSPALGRFIQPDPIGHNGGDENWYRYCGNACAQYLDPEGLWYLTGGVTVGLKGSASLGMSLGTNKGGDFIVSLYGGGGVGAGLMGSGSFSRHGHLNAGVTTRATGSAAFFRGATVTYDAMRQEVDTSTVRNLSTFGLGVFAGMEGEIGINISKTGKLISNASKQIASIVREAMQSVLGKTMSIEIGTSGGGEGGGDTPGGGSGGGQITSEADWLKISTNKNASTATYSLGADVTLTDYRCVVYSFTGTLAGNGHKIVLKKDISDGRLFSGTITGATFDRVKFAGRLFGDCKDCKFTGCEAVGNGMGKSAFAESARNCTFENCKGDYADTARGAFVTTATDCTFRGCKVNVKIQAATSSTGGLVGSATGGSFTDCAVSGSVDGGSRYNMIGGLVGSCDNVTLTKCQSSAVVTGEDVSGGLVGKAEGCTFVQCAATGAVSCPSGVAGGLVGSVKGGTISGCRASGKVTASGGGLVGKSKDTGYEQCVASGAVVGGGGGFAGTLDGDTVRNCKASGEVAGRSPLGGFVGNAREAKVSNSSAAGNVKYDGSSDVAGGFGGFVGTIGGGSSFEQCSASGNVTADGLLGVGGFVGEAQSTGLGLNTSVITILKCFATGNAIGGTHVGGFAGALSGCMVSDCLSSGAATATGQTVSAMGYSTTLGAVGGFVGSGFIGYFGDRISRCYACGKVTVMFKSDYSNIYNYKEADAGGFSPLSLTGDCDACYWNIDTTGQSKSGMGIGLGSSKAKIASSFSGWDFSDTWKIVNGNLTLPGSGATVADDPTGLGGGDPSSGGDDPAGGGASDPAAAVDVAGDPACGSVSGEGTYEAGETVKLTAAPTADCLFDGWYADAACTMLVSSESAWSFVVEDPAQRYFAKFSTKASKLDETRVYCYDRYVAHKGMMCWFQVDGFAPIGTTLAVSGIPAGFTFDGENMMVCGTATRTGSCVMTMTTTSAAGTKTRKIPFVVIDADGGPDDAPCAEFAETTVAAAEGGVVRVTVYGGGSGGKSSALLYFTPGSADAKDVDLANVAVDGVKVPKAKFPLALSWGADDNAAKTVEIPVKTDKTVEGDEFFLLQLGGADGQDLGENRTCRVSIVDATVSVPLAQAANVPLLKVTTKGDGKWIAAKGNVFHFPDAERGMYHVRSPELKPGQSSTLEFAGIKGMGVLKVYYRFIGEYDGGVPATLRILENREPLEPDSALSHAESGTGKYYFTVDERNDGAHTYSCVFTQGDNPDVRMEIVSVQWTPSAGSNPVTICVSSNGSGFGTVTGSGTYQIGETVKLTAKPAAGRTFAGWYKASASTGQYELYDDTHASLTFKATETMDIVAFFLDTPYVLGLAEQADRGKVTGGGFCAVGKKVTLKATANNGYVFMGWYRGDGTLVAKTASIVIDRSAKPTKDSASSTTITGITSDVTYYAVYVTAEKDAASIGATVDGFAFGAAAESGGSTVNATNVMAGVYLEWPVAASALSETTVKVAGLPSGLKFTAKPITTKVTSGTGALRVTAVVTNVPANTIYGAPTAASKTAKDKTTGLMTVTPSKVKVTVTTAGKSKAEYEIDLTVDPLPAWAVGEFSGLASTPEGRRGSASMSVTAAGKVSGKVIVNGTNCTFSATSYDITSKTVGETNLVAAVTGKLGKEAVTGEVTVVSGGASASLADASVTLFRNVWKDKGAEPVPEDAQGLYTAKLGAGERGTGYLSHTVDKKGAVKVAGKAPDGTALSGSATLMPDGDGAYFADVFCAPSAYKGGYVAGRLAWDADGKVSSECLDWRSFNPQSTTDYYAGGFERTLDLTGVRYVKTDAPKSLGVADVRLATPEGAELKTFSFTQSTGVWKGTLLWDFGDPALDSVKVPFEGVMVQGENLEGFGTYDVSASYVPYDKNGNPQQEKTYKVKESLAVRFGRE